MAIQAFPVLLVYPAKLAPWVLQAPPVFVALSVIVVSSVLPVLPELLEKRETQARPANLA